ncbi:MAG: TonB-dependent receptor [Thermodesulfobacteriota bacterium]|nr:TonB-dependent receptor [Thermodesulfobacteriota bacterium]
MSRITGFRSATMVMLKYFLVLGITALLGLCSGLSPHSAIAADESASPDTAVDILLEMSLEELMDVPIVTSVEGTAATWFNTPSAVYVITAEDIRRSGHRSLAEALRMVPGMQVLQDGSSTWQVTARGFSVRFANKLLVLIDGRTVFDPFFSGTFWDIQDVVLKDIDRIEVIRGPGATLWGANAVNGVINIITKRAEDTKGTYLTGGIGNLERGFGAVRHGEQSGESTFYRLWTKYVNRDQFRDSSGTSTHDDWDFMYAGFRLDTLCMKDKDLTLQGDFYHSDNIGEFVPVPDPTGHLLYDNTVEDGRVTGGNALFRLSDGLSDAKRGWTLQGYYERADRVLLADLLSKRDTVDLDWRHRFPLGDQHQLIWGLGWRRHDTRTERNDFISFDPASRTTNLYSTFFQDTITLVPQRLFVMLGSKFEENDFTGFEWQPSGRIWYTPDDRQMFWAAVSRPVRTPSLSEYDMTLTAAYVDLSLLGFPVPPETYGPAAVTGNRATKSEKLVAYEMGYRLKATEDITIDTTLFYNDYRDLITYSETTLGAFKNTAKGESYGGEAMIAWQVADNWRVEASYSFMHMDVDPDDVSYNGNHIPHMAHCRSYLEITDDIEFNVGAYWQESRENVGADVENDRGVRLDAGLTWRPLENLELALVGQNLLTRGRFESSDSTFQALKGEVPRAFYIQASCRY